MNRSWATTGLLTLTVVGAVTLSSCASGASDASSATAGAAPVDGGSMTIAVDREVPTLDPALGVIAQQPLLVLANAVYEPLMKPGAGGTIEPGLAESLEADESATVWTLTLPEGLSFSDGTPLTAEEVKLHLERLGDPESGSTSVAQVSQIVEMSVDDPTTLTMTLAMPNSEFGAQFTRSLGMVASTTATDAFGFPLGAGPYIVDDFAGGDSVTVVPNDAYAGEEQGYLDEIVFAMMPDTESRLQSLQAGDVDAIWTETMSHFSQAREDDSLVVDATPAAVSSLVLNLSDPDFADADVRTALAQAIDRDALNAVVNLGEGVVVDSPYALLGDMAPEVDYPTYDEDAAREVLEGRGIAFDLSVPSRTETVQLATAVQDMLAAVDVEVTIDPIEPAAFSTTLLGGDFEAVDFVTSLFADAAGGQYIARTGSPYNFAGYSNETADAAIDVIASTTDEQVRAENMQIVADELATDLPILWLAASNAGFIASADVAGMPDLDGYTLVSVQPAQLGWAEAAE